MDWHAICVLAPLKTWPLLTSQAFSPWASPAKMPVSCLQPRMAFYIQSPQTAETAKNAVVISKNWTSLPYFKLSGVLDCDRRQAKCTGWGQPAIHGKETRHPLRAPKTTYSLACALRLAPVLKICSIERPALTSPKDCHASWSCANAHPSKKNMQWGSFRPCLSIQV